MSEPSSPDADPRSAKNASKSLFERLTTFMRRSEPEDREDIKAVLEAAHDRQVLDGDSYAMRSEEHTSELQSLMRISYAVFCLKKKNTHNTNLYSHTKTTTNTH